MDKRFTGIVVPMVTTFLEDGRIDINGVEKLMNNFGEFGISPLILGTTGESASLGEKESIDLVAATLSAKQKGQQVYAGVVQNDVAQQISLGKAYLQLGADAVVATLPAYYPLTSVQMQYHFEKLADELAGPLLIYNIKATTQMSIPLSIIASLSNHPNILGLKDSERDKNRLKEAIDRFRERDDFSYFCGWGAAAAESLQLGADGIVPSTGNLTPSLYAKLWLAAQRKDWVLASKLQHQTDLVGKVYQKDFTLGESLAALKGLLESEGICKPHMKPPLTALPADIATKVMAAWLEIKDDLDR